jgi:hypothetical protein
MIMKLAKRFCHVAVSVSVFAGVLGAGCGGARAMVVTPTTDPTALLDALVANPSAFSSISASYDYGDPQQIGTYTGFNLPPVTMPNGVVMSTGLAAQTTAAYHSTGFSPSTELPVTATSGGSTPEIDAYAAGHVANWSSSHDAAKLTLHFTLAAPTAVSFAFSFGSVEYPAFTSTYTDAFYAFLDGTQISFDSQGNPVQVGNSFASTLTTEDQNTAFSDPHGLIGVLTTESGTLSAGAHVISFEVADTNDQDLDSAVFLTDFGTTTNAGGPTTNPSGLPEPGSMAIIGVAVGGLGWVRRRRGGLRG